MTPGVSVPSRVDFFEADTKERILPDNQDSDLDRISHASCMRTLLDFAPAEESPESPKPGQA
jgi:hypothetical protein